jgi:hypothetical protein
MCEHAILCLAIAVSSETLQMLEEVMVGSNEEDAGLRVA